MNNPFRLRSWLKQVNRFWLEFVLTLAIYNLVVGALLYIAFHI